MAPASGSRAEEPLQRVHHAPINARIDEAVLQVCTSLASLFASLPNSPTRPVDLVQALDVDLPLASRLVRMAGATVTSEAFESLPTLNQLRRAAENARGRCPGVVVDRAAGAVDRLADLVQEFGEDQREFESVANAHLDGGVRRVELAQRKAAFKANSFLWGQSAGCVSMTLVLFPGQDAATLDALLLHGYVGVRLLRPGATITLSLRVNPINVPAPTGPELPGPELLREYSTVASTSVQRGWSKEGFSENELRLDAGHPAHRSTFYTRHLVPNCAVLAEPESCFTETHVTWPMERLHLELAVPAGLTDPATRSVRMFANRKNPSHALRKLPADELPIGEQAVVFQNTQSLPPVVGLPGHPEMFAEAIDWIGKRGMAFDIYRCDVDYPMLHALITLGAGYASNDSKRR